MPSAICRVAGFVKCFKSLTCELSFQWVCCLRRHPPIERGSRQEGSSMGFGSEIVSADSGQDLSHFVIGFEITSVSNDRWLLLWICDPTNGEKGGYLRSPVQKNLSLFWGNVSEVETTEKFNFPSVPNAQQRNFQCSIWPDTVECPWAKAPSSALNLRLEVT